MDGGSVHVDNLEVLKLCDFFNEMLDDSIDVSDTITVPKISLTNLNRVIEYNSHYLETPMTYIPKPLVGNKLEENINDTWYFNFVKNLTRNELIKFTDDVNFLGNRPLLQLLCAKIAFEIKGKQPNEIKEMFDIEL